jgi:asparagine N-glycosylation enzyme membrane subunit Stt3
MTILESASKLVFVLLAITACAAFFMGRLEAQDFMVLAMAAFTFYFSHKGEQLPFAGK